MDNVDLALRLIKDGKPFERVVVDEGDAENGPLALRYHGFRMGQVFLETGPTGETYLFADGRNGDCLPLIWWRLPSPYSEKHDFRVRRVHRALGWKDATTMLAATRAERKANHRRLGPDHHCVCV